MSDHQIATPKARRSSYEGGPLLLLSGPAVAIALVVITAGAYVIDALNAAARIPLVLAPQVHAVAGKLPVGSWLKAFVSLGGAGNIPVMVLTLGLVVWCGLVVASVLSGRRHRRASNVPPSHTEISHHM